MVRKLVNICAGAESATSPGHNYRPNLVFFLDLIQRLNDRIDQLIVESIQLSRTFKRKNGHRFTIAAGENVGTHNDLNWRFVQLPVNPPTINPERNSTANGRRLEHEPRMDANKSGGEFLQWPYQLPRRTVRASTSTAPD